MPLSRRDPSAGRAILQNPCASRDGRHAIKFPCRYKDMIAFTISLTGGATMKGFVQNIEDITVKNEEFRRVLYTAKNCQLVAMAVSYTHLRAHETPEHLVCRLLLE